MDSFYDFWNVYVHMPGRILLQFALLSYLSRELLLPGWQHECYGVSRRNDESGWQHECRCVYHATERGAGIYDGGYVQLDGA